MRECRWVFCAALAIACLAFGSLVRPAAADPAVYEVGDDPSLGFNLISWSNFGANGPAAWQTAVQGLGNAGFREVSISPVRYFNTSTFAISSTSSSGPDLNAIEAGVVRAKSLGMRVTLNPFVEPQNFVAWRATYNPQGAAATQFWGDYQNYLVAVAQIAEAHGVEAMTVGTELNGMSDKAANASHWNDVINAVAAVYHGQIGYASNWDDYANANLTASIWENPNVDFIGTDSYFGGNSSPLFGWFKHLNPGMSNSQITALVDNAVNPIQTYPDQSFIDLMTNAWNWKLDNELLPFAAARKDPDGAGPLPAVGMPIEFTEQGYLYSNTTAKNPQTDSPGTLDTAEQRMAFQGLLNALDHRGDKFEAVDVWQWWMSGSSGSHWNIDPLTATQSHPVDQPNNQDLALFLQSFVGTAVRPLAGDYNRDGVVDNLDYVVWQNTFGKFATDFNGADGNGNGVVDAADYTVWRDNLNPVMVGAGGGANSDGTVPEPSSIALAIAAFAILSMANSAKSRARRFFN
jgi:Glycoside Hydrolase Family 113